MPNVLYDVSRRHQNQQYMEECQCPKMIQDIIPFCKLFTFLPKNDEYQEQFVFVFVFVGNAGDRIFDKNNYIFYPSLDSEKARVFVPICQIIEILFFPDAPIQIQNLESLLIILFLMFQLIRSSKMFSKVKQFKLNVLGTHPLKFSSEPDKHQWEVQNPLEHALSALVACQIHTLKDYCKRENLQIHSINVKSVESSYDLANYMKGGNASKLNDVTIEAEIETNGSQQQLDAIHKKVENSCPVYQMIKGSGVKITNNWKNIKKQ